MNNNYKNKKLVIFDLDGTLIDSFPDVYKSFNNVLLNYDYPTKSSDFIRSLLGKNLFDIVSKLINTTQEDSINDFSKSYINEYANLIEIETKKYEGIDLLLKLLKKHDIKVVINTNKEQSLAEKYVNRLFNEFSFDEIIGYDVSRPSKPDPYAVNEILRKFQLHKKDVIYIGDSLSDFKTSFNADVDFVLVTWGYGNYEELMSISNIKITNSVNELINVLGV